MKIVALLAGFGLLVATPAFAASPISCHALTGKSFGAATVLETEMIAPPHSIASLGTFGDKGVQVDQPFCRVRGSIKPSADSDIRFEIWLPIAENWNGRFQAVGNGGFAGNIAYAPMRWALGGGYVVAATDTGHVGPSSDSSWAVGHSEKIIDLGWRAMHETTVVSKAVIAAYFGKPATRHYYAGCSTGGRQGLVLAQKFPADFDGIVVGAPANDWPRLLSFGAAMYQKLDADPKAWLSPEKLALLHQTSQKSCRAEGGLLDDPGACKIDAAKLQCRPGQTKTCLSSSEVAMAKLMYEGVRDTKGALVYPGFTPGLETTWSLWNLGSAGTAGRDSLAFPYPAGFYGNLVHQDRNWTLDNYNLERDLPSALASSAGQAVYAENPDLSAFFNRGGKLLHYHGWHDPAIPANSSLHYFASVAAKMGGQSRIDASYRLFMGTGMLHCAGGPGPNAIGGSGPPPPGRDAVHDVVETVRDWVENNKAPERIIATHYNDNNPAARVEAQRPWCAWPSVARFVGGDRSKAESYRCSPPAKGGMSN